MINNDENERTLDYILNKVFSDLNEYQHLAEMKNMFNQQAKLCRMAYDSFRSQGFSQDQSFDAAINMMLTLFENSIKGSQE